MGKAAEGIEKGKIIGEIRTGKELGYKARTKRKIWAACLDCGKERWVNIRNGQPINLRCQSCSNRITSFRSGKRKDSDGYIRVWLPPTDFFYPMVNKDNHVMEHRLVMAKHLGRSLHSWEIVHHKNHIRDDNRIENLQLVSEDRHLQITLLETRIHLLEKRVTMLEAENALLAKQLEEVRYE